MHSKQLAKSLRRIIRTLRSPFTTRARTTTLALGVLLFTSCARAPSFNILGSFFPAWLVCLILAVLFTVITGWLLLRLQVPIAVPALTYPALTALLTFALWLIFFGW
jgi:hypothetical protein